MRGIAGRTHCTEVEGMRNAGELERENEALRDRLSRLSEASRRIN